MDETKVFGMPAEKGRWLFILLGIMVLLCLGTVYSWSIFRKPLEKLLNIGATDSLLPFTVLLVVYAVLMPITGFFIDKYGSRTVTAVGGVVTGIGYILSAFAPNIYALVFTLPLPKIWFRDEGVCDRISSFCAIWKIMRSLVFSTESVRSQVQC